jgi:hypothetical protein
MTENFRAYGELETGLKLSNKVTKRPKPSLET